MKHLFFTAITLILLFTSCNRDGGEKSVFDYIPDGTPDVVLVDLDAILKNAGCRIRDGKVTTSPAMDQLLDALTEPEQQEFTDALIRLYPVLDLKQVALAAGYDNMAAVVPVKDLEQIELYLQEKGMEAESRVGTIYVIYGLTVALEGDMAILTESPEQSADWLELSAEAPLSLNTEVMEIFSMEEHTLVAMSMRPAGKRRHRGQEQQPMFTRLLQADVHEQFIDGALTLYDPAWQPIDLQNYILPAEPELLTAVPYDAQGVLVAGEQVDLEGLLRLFEIESGDILPTEAQLLMLGDFLSGPLMVSASPASTSTYLRSLQPPAWVYTGALLREDDAVSSLLNLIAMLNGGDSPRNQTEEEGQTRLRITPDISLYVKQNGNLMTLSTDYIRSSSASDTYAPLMEGASFGIFVNVPYNSETMRAFNLPYAPNLTIVGRDTEISFRFSLNGSRTAILQALGETIQAAQ
ncbi:MAG: hypothetical protein K2O00_01825 [Muribaculaceae bacterium]|nr:hypothetical protein [Muribaculaceae bacterium]